MADDFSFSEYQREIDSGDRSARRCEGTRRRVDGSPYRCPLVLVSPDRTLCGRCEMAVEELGIEQRWITTAARLLGNRKPTNGD